MITLFSRVQVGKTFQYMGHPFEKTSEKRAKTGTATWIFEGREKVEVVDETALTDENTVRHDVSYSIEPYNPLDYPDCD